MYKIDENYILVLTQVLTVIECSILNSKQFCDFNVNADKGVYNTDVIDTDYSSWLILLHCSDPESEKKFLSTFVLSRTAYIDRLVTEYLREKIGHYNVPMEYLFPVNQTFCFGERNYVEQADLKITTPTAPSASTMELDLEEDSENNDEVETTSILQEEDSN